MFLSRVTSTKMRTGTYGYLNERVGMEGVEGGKVKKIVYHNTVST